MENTVVKCIRAVADRLPDQVALKARDAKGAWHQWTYREFCALAEQFGAGLLDLGVKRGDHIGIISDNRREWIIADQGILGIGAADVPRGSDTMPDEMRHILQHADCGITLAENAEQLAKILSRKKDLPLLKTVIVIDQAFDPRGFKEPSQGLKVMKFAEVLDCGKKLLAKDPQAYRREVAKGAPDELVTLIYTSGTTGEPKGVMLTNSNYLHNLRTTVPYVINVDHRDTWLSVLPVWHSFERVAEYVIFYNACTMAYSKPAGKIIMTDMAEIHPTVMASAPRLWEIVRANLLRMINEEGGIKKALFTFFLKVGTVHQACTNLVRGLMPDFTRRSRVLDFLAGIVPFILLWPLRALGNVLVFSKLKTRLGGKFRFSVSGGGALPSYVDKFFATAGILMLEGYGLTETTPIISVRLERRPIQGTIGPALAEQEIKLLDPETHQPVGPGKKGVLFVKGPNVMKGYYKRPDKTAEILGADGFLDTGDLGMITYKGELKIIGRTKETIVLLGGENVEPVPIEDAISECEYIDQIMVVGQDQKFLGALVVPNLEALEKWAQGEKVPYTSKEDLLDNAQANELITEEINARVNADHGFRIWERIFRFRMIPKPFEVGVELSGTLKMKRNVIAEMYKKELAEIFRK
ncbi:MAG: AMP-binding protein [Spirochaetes bacterium]|nr:AMP-binding protein [Spirochaetota bacterium]